MEKKVDILYAEDDRLTAEMIKELLEEHEFGVRIACDGLEAWEIYNYRAPDLLLLDLEMPGKDGLQLVKLIRETNKRMPIIFYSSHMDVEKELQAIKLGAEDCIHKGGLPELLVEKLKNIYHRITQDEKNPQLYFLSTLTKFNAAAGLLTIDKRCMPLKSMDSRLLQLLCVKLHEVAGNEYLIRGLWGNVDCWCKENALRKCVKHLRGILEADSSLSIENCYGEGYCLTTRR